MFKKKKNHIWFQTGDEILPHCCKQPWSHLLLSSPVNVSSVWDSKIELNFSLVSEVSYLCSLICMYEHDFSSFHASVPHWRNLVLCFCNLFYLYVGTGVWYGAVQLYASSQHRCSFLVLLYWQIFLVRFTKAVNFRLWLCHGGEMFCVFSYKALVVYW